MQIQIYPQTSIEPKKNGAFYSNNEVSDHTLCLVIFTKLYPCFPNFSLFSFPCVLGVPSPERYNVNCVLRLTYRFHLHSNTTKYLFSKTKTQNLCSLTLLQNSKFLIISSPAKEWRNLDTLYIPYVGWLFCQLQRWGTRDVQLIQCFSADGKTTNMLKCLKVEMLKCWNVKLLKYSNEKMLKC